MILQAFAKINLYLDITGKRADGYHLLETVMQSVDLSDIVTVELSQNAITAECSDPTVPSGEGNICYKAARLFFENLNTVGGVSINIDKRIPHGAGLGGGSADAAAVLAGLNKLYGNPFGEDGLLQIGAKIGADVPFCMTGGTKLCRGIGEVMTDISPYPAKCFLIVKPPFSLATGAAYAEYDRRQIPPRVRGGAEYYNIFREVYSDDRIDRIVNRLSELGAVGAELTGSGSAVFGAFEDEGSAVGAARNFPECFTAVCRSTGAGVEVLP